MSIMTYEYSSASCQDIHKSVHVFLLPFQSLFMFSVPINETHQLLLSPYDSLSGNQNVKRWPIDSHSPFYWLCRDHINSIWIHSWL